VRVGVTASRDGISPAQGIDLQRRLQAIRIVEEFHHGDCKGGDVACLLVAVRVANVLAYESHPATLSYEWDLHWRAHTATRFPELMQTEHPALPPLSRNRVIVDSVDQMFAYPKSADDRIGGTWATIQYAWRRKVPIVVIGPNGEEIERG